MTSLNHIRLHRPAELCRRSCIAVVCLAAIFGAARSSTAAEWYAAPDGAQKNEGTRQSPWDLASALSGGQKIAPGDTLWLGEGTYRHPNRKGGSHGYHVRLAGKKDAPITIRGERGKRVTIDGGLTVVGPSTFLTVRDLEIVVSENLTMSRTVKETGSHPKDYNRPWGGLNIHAGEGCRYVNLVIHDNAQGISFWKNATDSEIHGCLIDDNGWKAPDRGHGHGLYTQNKDGLKTISNCIFSGGYAYSVHAYGSSRAWVDNYLFADNICDDAGQFLIGGGRPSRNIRVRGNLLYSTDMRLGYSAPHNENCVVRDNVIVDGRLRILRFRKVDRKGNHVLSTGDKRPETPRIEVRPNKYDPDRAHLAVFNWQKRSAVEWKPGTLLKRGDRYQLKNPTDFYGDPVLEGAYGGGSIRIPMAAEFAAFVLLKSPLRTR